VKEAGLGTWSAGGAVERTVVGKDGARKPSIVRCPRGRDLSMHVCRARHCGSDMSVLPPPTFLDPLDTHARTCIDPITSTR